MFTNCEYDLYENLFDLDFLAQRDVKIYEYLAQIFNTKHCLCLILNKEYNYVWKDWFNSNNYRVALSTATEQYELNKMKSNNLNVKIYLL